MALEENKYDHLVELGGSGYEIVDGEPNIKGWDVKDQSGLQIGEVDELLFDSQSRRVRYLVVDLEQNKFGLVEDKKVLVPIGLAELYKDGQLQDEENDLAESSADYIDNPLDIHVVHDVNYNPFTDGKVVIVSISEDQLAALPPYQKGQVSPEIETNVRDIFAGVGGTGFISGSAFNREEFYSHDHFDENRFYDRRSSDDEGNK